MSENIKLGFLASGGGSSVESLVRKIQSGELEGFSPEVIICDKPYSKAGIYERAKDLKLNVVNTASSKTQLELLRGLEIDLVLGLGYVKLVGDEMLNHFGNRIWNIHPTLLPRHGGKGMYGLATHMSVLKSGDKITGPTVHMMGPEYDDARLILKQIEIPVPSQLIGKPTEDNAKTLQQLVLVKEYEIMPQVLELYRDNKLPNCNRF